MTDSPSPFAALGLRDELVRAVVELGYEQPTPIQVQAIPVVLAGRDVMGGAQTGTGKTAGFTLPLLQRLMPHANASPSPARHPVRALVLTPTRELAIQVEEAVRGYGKHSGLRCGVVYGGVDIDKQIPMVRAGVEVLVATPGRLLDHLHQKTLTLGQVEILVLDEADRMLDMGFIPDIKRIIAQLPAKRQNLLFSATFSGEIKKLADEMLNEPQLIEVARRNTAAETVEQRVYKVGQDRKRALLGFLFRELGEPQALVFSRTKHGAGRLARLLERDGFSTAAIHGDKTQQARLEALEGFKSGAVKVLVATDVAARGLDIDELPYVVNYEIPYVPEDYIHRIGRTGRAGASGIAISLVSPDEEKLLADIEKLIKRRIAVSEAAGFSGEGALEPGDARPERGRGERGAGRERSAERDRGSARPRGGDRERQASRAPAVRDDAPRPRAPREDAWGERPRDRSHYDLNPDQPLPATQGAAAGSSALAGTGAAARAGRRPQPIPALLMKRPKPVETTS
jgi:ATP-dependent RNA helicase RhlE